MLHRIPFVSLRRLLLIAAATGLALLLLPQTATAQESVSDVQVPDTADAVVQVHGMACSGCARRMKSALEGVEGVDQATVLLDKQRVLLTLAGEKSPSEKTLRKTVRSAGYEFRNATFAKERTKGGAGG